METALIKGFQSSLEPRKPWRKTSSGVDTMHCVEAADDEGDDMTSTLLILASGVPVNFTGTFTETTAAASSLRPLIL